MIRGIEKPMKHDYNGIERFSSKGTKIAILGDGGWGTALSVFLSGKGYSVYLWSNFSEYADLLNQKRENIKFLPGIKIPESIEIGHNLEEAVRSANLIVFAVPSKFMRDICKKVKDVSYKKVRCFLSVAKGVEIDSLKRMSEVIEKELSGVSVAVLSGPSHAEEVSRNLPTAVVTASKDIEIAKYIQKMFMGERFRVYTSSDLIGVELSGALKNVIAVAVGVCDGLGLGDSAKSALMTRGIAEITRLGIAMGGKKETFSGLAGVGDVIVTCTSKYGRNLNFGRILASGKSVASALSSSEMVVEGVTTAKAAFELGKKYKVDLPIINEVYSVLYESKPYKQAIQDLMLRAPKAEV